MKHGLFFASTLAILISTQEVNALETSGFKPDKSVVYKTTEQGELKLHIFNPEGHRPSDSRPAIVFFFGGGWMGGTPSQFYPHCEYLSSRSMVAISAEYRVQNTHKTSPKECVKDGKSAVRWIRKNAEKLGVDPAKVLAGGGSAGGHVAAATGTATSFEEDGEDKSISSRPEALVLFNPVYNNGPGGYGHDRVKEYWREISPAHNITKDTPPTLVMFGTKDKHAAPEISEDYKHKMEEKGVRCDLLFYEGQKHGFFNFGNRDNYIKTVTAMDKFLTSLGYLEGEPTLESLPDREKPTTP